MKRYDLILTPMGRTSIGEVAGGRFVLADDPAIQAAIEAMNQSVVQYEYMLEVWKSQPTTYPNQDSECQTRQETLRAALAGLKGPA